jgi:hypothetical protein
MSLDLSVLVDKKLTEQQMQSVYDFLQANGFCKDRYGYHATADNIALNVYPDSDPENNDFWTEDPPSVVWFAPKTDIGLESRHNRESHEMNYRLAKELAKIVGGVIYDNQVGMVYDADGKPFDHCKTGDRFDEYGAGMDLFMRSVGLFSAIIGEKNYGTKE